MKLLGVILDRFGVQNLAIVLACFEVLVVLFCQSDLLFVEP